MGLRHDRQHIHVRYHCDPVPEDLERLVQFVSQARERYVIVGNELYSTERQPSSKHKRRAKEISMEQALRTSCTVVHL